MATAEKEVSVAPAFDRAETETAGRRKLEFASTFDALIASNLALTTSVGRLVKLSWAIIVLNVALITAVVAMTARSHQ